MGKKLNWILILHYTQNQLNMDQGLKCEKQNFETFSRNCR